MAKDYVRYVTYRKARATRGRFCAIFGLCAASLLLILVFFFLKSDNKQQVIRQTEDKLKQKILEVSDSQPPKPKFDFYNILPQDNLTLSFPSVQLNTVLNEEIVNASSKKILDSRLVNTATEGITLTGTETFLNQEEKQFSNAVYSLILGNFQDSSQAEQYQAQALLKGFPVKSKRINVNKGVNYQLFMGPYNFATASEQQKRLHAAGIRVKIKPQNA